MPPFETFYEAAWPGAVRLAHALTGIDAVAQDLAQEAFIRMHRHWDRVDEPAAYLRTAVVNACRSWHRSRSREEARVARLDSPPMATLPPEEHETLEQLAALPERQREALVLRFYAEATDDEIAAALGCRAGTVRSLISRGLAELRKVMSS